MYVLLFIEPRDVGVEIPLQIENLDSRHFHIFHYLRKITRRLVAIG